MENKQEQNILQDKYIHRCGELLKEKKLSIAFAESATAGRVMADLSLIENAGEFLKGGLVCYDVCIKEDLLGVSHGLIEHYTAESAEVTEAVAKGLRSIIKADVHVAITGLMKPGGSETINKPVGTLFTHILYKDKPVADRIIIDRDCASIVEEAVEHVAKLLLTVLKN